MNGHLLKIGFGALLCTSIGIFLLVFPDKVRDWEVKNNGHVQEYRNSPLYPLFVQLIGLGFLGFGIGSMIDFLNQFTHDELIGFAFGAIFWTASGIILLLFPEKVRDWEVTNSSWAREFKSASFYPTLLRMFGIIFVGAGIISGIGFFHRL